MNDRLEQYSNDLVPLAVRVVGAVHDEGPGAVRDALAAVCALPAPDGVNPADALVTILAAMVDPTRSPNELLDWTRGIDGGTSALHPEPTKATARDAPRSNPLAVEMALSGRLPLHALADHEARQVVATLRRRDWNNTAIAMHLDAEVDQVRRYVNTRRKAAA